MQEIRVRSLGWEVPLEKDMATHSSIPAWTIPWRSLVGYSPWGRKESDTTERLNFHFLGTIVNTRDGRACVPFTSSFMDSKKQGYYAKLFTKFWDRGKKYIYICIYISIYGTQPPGMTFEQLLKDKQIKKGWCYIWRTSYIIKIWRPIRSGDKLIQLRCGLAGVGAVEKHFAFLAPWEAFAVDCLPFQGEEGSSLLLCLCVPPVATIQSTV